MSHKFQLIADRKCLPNRLIHGVVYDYIYIYIQLQNNGILIFLTLNNWKGLYSILVFWALIFYVCYSPGPRATTWPLSVALICHYP